MLMWYKDIKNKSRRFIKIYFYDFVEKLTKNKNRIVVDLIYNDIVFNVLRNVKILSSIIKKPIEYERKELFVSYMKKIILILIKLLKNKGIYINLLLTKKIVKQDTHNVLDLIYEIDEDLLYTSINLLIDVDKLIIIKKRNLKNIILYLSNNPNKKEMYNYIINKNKKIIFDIKKDSKFIVKMLKTIEFNDLLYIHNKIFDIYKTKLINTKIINSTDLYNSLLYIIKNNKNNLKFLDLFNFDFDIYHIMEIKYNKTFINFERSFRFTLIQACLF